MTGNGGSTPIRVVLADDHTLFRAGLRALLESLPDVDVVGETDDGQEALRLAVAKRPHVVVLDITMPGLNGLTAAARITREAPGTKVLILSMHADEEYVREALQAGASGYLLKEARRDELELALRAVARGEPYLSPKVARPVVDGFVGGGVPGAGSIGRLTARQREVLQLIAEGHPTKAIAARLQLSVKTVEAHRATIMKRLDIHDVPGLVRYAIRAGLVTIER